MGMVGRMSWPRRAENDPVRPASPIGRVMLGAGVLGALGALGAPYPPYSSYPDIWLLVLLVDGCLCALACICFTGVATLPIKCTKNRLPEKVRVSK